MALTVVPDTTSAPFKFVGKWFYASGGAGSGIVLGENYVLTAAHVLAQMGDGAVFIPGLDAAGSTPFGNTSRDSTGPNYSAFQPGGGVDIAAVRVTSNTSIPTRDIPGIVVFYDPNLALGNVTSAGYPGGHSGMYFTGGQIVSATASGVVSLSTDFTVETGQSGSPIFYQFDGKTYTAGVVSGFWLDPYQPVGTVFTPISYAGTMGALKSAEKVIDPKNLPENLIQGSTYGETIRTYHRSEKVFADAGADTVYASLGSDDMKGGAGHDTVHYDLEPEPIEVAGGGQVPVPPFDEMTATVKANAPAGSVEIAFDDQFGRTTQRVVEFEEIVLSLNADTVKVEGGAQPADLLIDASDQLVGDDVLDFSGYAGPVYLADVKDQSGTFELFADRDLKRGTGLEFKRWCCPKSGWNSAWRDLR
ncbi:MAG: trypsin-like peptidase domain-containing protein [Xanthobacteraceae bacterium]|nr:trypsin-like peptidase domain-containing protein [Xanthobacteraceae bacterium]